MNLQNLKELLLFLAMFVGMCVFSIQRYVVFILAQLLQSLIAVERVPVCILSKMLLQSDTPSAHRTFLDMRLEKWPHFLKGVFSEENEWESSDEVLLSLQQNYFIFFRTGNDLISGSYLEVIKCSIKKSLRVDKSPCNAFNLPAVFPSKG